MGVTIGIVIGCVMVTLSLLFRDDLGVLRNLVLIWGTPLAILLALWRSMVAERQVKVAQRGLTSNQYQRAVEMLGSNLVSVRLGGIYALRNLAFEHYDEYGRDVWNLLNIYHRNPHSDGLDKGKVVPVMDREGRVVNLPEVWVAEKAADGILEHGKRIAQGKPISPWWEE